MSIPTLRRPVRSPVATEQQPPLTLRWLPLAWTTFVVVALVLLDVMSLRTWAWTVLVAAAALVSLTAPAVGTVA